MSNPQYLYTILDFVEKSTVENTIHFTEHKQFKSGITAGQL